MRLADLHDPRIARTLQYFGDLGTYASTVAEASLNQEWADVVRVRQSIVKHRCSSFTMGAAEGNTCTCVAEEGKLAWCGTCIYVIHRANQSESSIDKQSLSNQWLKVPFTKVAQV